MFHGTVTVTIAHTPTHTHTHTGKPLIEGTTVQLNYGNRYGFLGPNGSGKSTIMKALAARTIPIPGRFGVCACV